MNTISTTSSYKLALIYFALMLIPMELSGFVGDLRLEPYRVFLILVFLFNIRGMYHLYKNDTIAKWLGFYCFLCLISYLVNHGSAGFQSAAILFLEVWVGYFIGSRIAGDHEAFKKVLRILILAYLILVPFAIMEAQTGYRLLHMWAAKAVGGTATETLGPDYLRYGIHRAGTVFSHPILYSVCAVMFLPIIYVYYSKLKATLLSSGIFVAMVTSVTSAGVVMAIITLGLYFARKLSLRIPSIFTNISIAFISLFVFVSLFSDRGPVLFFAQVFSFNPQTAYMRYLQWMYASDDIAANPWWGIGFADWSRPHWMPDSVDSYWLITTLQNGYPALIALGIAFILSMKSYWQHWRYTGITIYFAYFCSIISLVFAAYTVDLFDRAPLIVFFAMGMFNSFLIKSLPEKVREAQRASPSALAAA
ncbi:hypothetical protein AUP74_01786 [Microbulbifer aggregans]|uniref:O-Antigen ligase n=1 Tax=Microbulbifer aggregans TaxID=1769779 RepID=A0A1C9W7S9_9GAMM|nr:hypothetical protein [Microbulbifer aggregans]AOS97217.1 hypothetical protein AUP74_01786 [Microbulbifer aggregans]